MMIPNFAELTSRERAQLQLARVERCGLLLV